MSFENVHIHKVMLQDKLRTEAYREALSETVKPGMTVLDFGCGTGILSFFAAQKGAGKVYAVDRSNFIKIAKIISGKNNFTNIEFHHSDEQSLKLQSEVDVIVSEGMGQFVFHNEWIIEPLIKIRDKYLADGGIMIPKEISLHAGFVTDKKIYDEFTFFNKKPYDIDFSFLGEWPLNQAYIKNFTTRQILDETVGLGKIDLLKCTKNPDVLEGEIIAPKTCKTYGLCGWFNALLTENVKLDTGPSAPQTHWKQIFFPFSRPYNLSKGKKTKIRISLQRDAQNKRTLWKWSVSGPDGLIKMDDFVLGAWLGKNIKNGILE